MPSGSALVPALVSIVPLSIGVLALGFGAHRGYEALRYLAGVHPGSTPSPASPETAADGHAAVSGVVRPGPDGTVAAPLSGADAVAYRLDVEQRTDAGDWATVAAYDDAARFYLEGTTDRLLVDPAGAAPTLDASTTVRAGPAETLPADVRDRFEAADEIDLAATPEVLAIASDAERRYAEAALEPGETAYVYGDCAVESTGQGYTARGRIAGDGSSTFAYGTEAAVRRANEGAVSGRETTVLLAVQGLVAALFGLFFVGVGAVLLSDAGVLAAAGAGG